MIRHGSICRINQLYSSVHRWNQNLPINSLALSNLRSFSTSLGDDDAFDTICKKQKGKKVLVCLINYITLIKSYLQNI